jgi:hypothetical protein
MQGNFRHPLFWRYMRILTSAKQQSLTNGCPRFCETTIINQWVSTFLSTFLGSLDRLIESVLEKQFETG